MIWGELFETGSGLLEWVIRRQKLYGPVCCGRRLQEVLNFALVFSSYQPIVGVIAEPSTIST